MKIAVRMDDITPDMDWGKFLRFKELCDLYQVKPLIGVIPSNMDENLYINDPATAPVKDFWRYIKELQGQGWCVAQHGVTHVYTTKRMGCFPLNRLSEFAGTRYEVQYKALKQGKAVLSGHGIETDIFMAPAHSFDRNTVKALRELGFCKMTDGFGDFPYTRRGMIFYPISHRQSEILKNIDKNGYTTFVIHTNVMDERDFERYEQIFEQYKDRLISYSDLFAVAPQKRGILGSAREYVMAIAKFLLISVKRKL